MRDQRIAPRDPIPQREALYILVDKPVGGGGSDAEANRFPVFLNDERLVTFAKIVGGVQDENILQMLRTANDTYNTAQFPYNWKKTSGKKPFQMELVCKSLQMVFKDSASLDFGRIRVTVDGQTVAYYDPREVGWTHCHATILFAEETAGKHHIEICMAPEDEGKTFTILGFGVVR